MPLGGTSYIITSHDDGLTWGAPTVIAEGGYNETGLCDLGEGRFLAVLRDDKVAALSQSRSDDDGATWSQPVQITEPREHPGDVIKLTDGRLLLTYGRRTTPCGVFGLISHDEGRSWDEDNRLFLATDIGRDLGYPSSIQRDDGTIVTVYYSDQLVVSQPRGQTIGIHGAAVTYRPEDLP
ncbi:MAG: exo-alpha-sialidase [Gemmatimonadetes bacterium]|nr:exo-alpha-sialidase [Gemmatimonadota bacterium]